MFIPYLENKSTLKYYGQTNIGSRPDKRGDKEKLDFNDLRAIPFVGSWSQLKQNVPGTTVSERPSNPWSMREKQID
jgi:phosphoenolpyruvate carboxylase